MAFEYESKTPQDVLVYTDSPIFLSVIPNACSIHQVWL